MNPLPLLIILLGILLIISAIKGSYKSITASVKKLLWLSRQ